MDCEESTHSEYEGPSSGHDHEEEDTLMNLLENKRIINEYSRHTETFAVYYHILM